MEKKILGFVPLVFMGIFVLLGVQDKVILSLFLMIWMVSWWVFEVLPLGITALIPMVFGPLLNLGSLKELAINYSNPVIYLFLGGFMIARALEKTGLNERIALTILKTTGKSDKGIVFGFIIATAFLSMWISNTATTVMMIPIAVSVVEFLRGNLARDSIEGLKAMEISLFLSIAYAANIGGIMTPIGTPPNVVFVGYLDDLYGVKVDFFKWFLITAPSGILLLFLMGKLNLTMFSFSVPVGKEFRDFVSNQVKNLGAPSPDQKLTFGIFLLTALLWIFKGVLHYFAGRNLFSDTSIAILGGMLLFLIPYKRKEWKPVLESEDIGKLPWNIVLLFGGGMALANILKNVGLIQMATDYFGQLNFSSIYWLVFVLAILTLFLTEVMSNVALCVVALPVIMNLGQSQGIDPFLFALPAALCSSFAFSMPISTPPNAIVFGTNKIKVSQMMKVGVLLNFISVLIVMTITWFLAKLFW